MEVRRSMWILATLAFFFVSTFGSEYYSRPDFSTHRRFLIPSSDEFGNSSQLVVRQPRAVNTKTDELLHKTSIVARIVNGIYLQAGLLDKTIPVEDVVGELLNLGSTKVSEVASFDGKNVKDLMTQIKGLPNAFDKSADTLAMEEYAIGYNAIRKGSENVKIPSDLSSFDKYITKVKDVQQKMSQQTIDEAFRPFHEIADLLVKVDLITDATHQDDAGKSENTNVVTQLETQITKAIAQLPKIEEINTNLKTLKDLSLDDLKPINTVIGLMKYRETIISTYVGAEGILKNEKVLNGINQTSSAAKPDFEKILNIVSTRFHPNSVTRIHSTGFTSGISDMKKLPDDIKDTWLSEVFRESGKVTKLRDGLKPLLELKADAVELSGKLDPISKKVIFQSLQTIFQYVTDIGSVKALPDADVSTLLSEYGNCQAKARKMQPNVFSPSENAIKKAEQMKQRLASAPVGTASVTETELKKFQSRIPKDNDLTIRENNALINIKAVRASGELESFKKVIKTFLDQVTQFNYLSALQDITNVVETKTIFEALQTHPATGPEFAMYDCLKAIGDNSEQLAKSIKLTKVFRSLGTNEITMVENAVTVIESLSTDFSKVKDILTSMEKEISYASKALQNLTEVKKMSETLGTAVKGVYSIQQFGKVQSSLTKLKDVGSDVDSEIGKLLDPQLKTSLQQKWGNHQTDMANVETVLGQVEQVEGGLNLTNIKTLKDLGTPLTSLSSITDVSMKVEEKLEVFNTLISSSSDANFTAKLNDAKGVLEPIEGLQLAFSSYQSGFSNSLGVLGAFESFLVPYLQKKHDKPGNGGKVKEDKAPIHSSDSTLLIVLIVCVLVLVAVVISFYFIWKRYSSDKKRRYPLRKLEMSKIEQTVAGQAHGGDMEASQFHVVVLRHMFRTLEGTDESQIQECFHRYPNIQCNPKTAVKMWNGPIPHMGQPTLIHANWIITESGTKFIATQGPLKINKGEWVNFEPAEDMNGTKRQDTCEDFWKMIFYFGVENIVMLCNFLENDSHKCGEYFPPIGKKEQYGSFTVETTAQSDLIKDEAGVTDVIERKLQITRGGKSKTVQHYQYVTWPEMDPPNDPTSSVKLLQIVEKSKSPIVVHCSGGVGRTTTFIGTKYIADTFEMNANAQFIDVMMQLREQRFGAIQKWRQSYFVQVSAVLYLQQKYEFKEDYFSPQFKLYKETIVQTDDELKVIDVPGNTVRS